MKAPDLVRFLRRLIRDARRKVFLILDRLQAHRAGLTRDWLAAHRQADPAAPQDKLLYRRPAPEREGQVQLTQACAGG